MLIHSITIQTQMQITTNANTHFKTVQTQMSGSTRARAAANHSAKAAKLHPSVIAIIVLQVLAHVLRVKVRWRCGDAIASGKTSLMDADSCLFTMVKHLWYQRLCSLHLCVVHQSATLTTKSFAIAAKRT